MPATGKLLKGFYTSNKFELEPDCNALKVETLNFKKAEQVVKCFQRAKLFRKIVKNLMARAAFSKWAGRSVCASKAHKYLQSMVKR